MPSRKMLCTWPIRRQTARTRARCLWAVPTLWAILALGLALPGVMLTNLVAAEQQLDSGAATPIRWNYVYGTERVTMFADTDRAAVLLNPDIDDPLGHLQTSLLSVSGFLTPDLHASTEYPNLWFIDFVPGLDEGERLAAVEALNGLSFVEFASLILHYERALQIPRPEILVVFDANSSAERLDELLQAGDLQVIRDFPAIDPTYLLAFDGTPQEGFARCEELRQFPGVVSATPNFIKKLEPHSTTPNDPSFASQWDLRNTGQYSGTPGADMNATQAWDLSTGSSSIIVAIIDEGVDVDHEDLLGNMVAGHDSVTADPTPEGIPGQCRSADPHGTCCAGLVAARGNNGIGISGINWNAKIQPVRVGFGSWWTQDDWIIDAVTWAANHGADVLSNSWGGGSPTTPEENAFNYATSLGRGGLGAATFCSSGNEDASSVSYPAAYGSTIAVGATSPCDERKSTTSCDGEWWWGSNHGSALDIVAPGPLVTSTDIMGSGGYTSGNYSDFSGTSSACPHAAGAAALLLSVDGSLTAGEVRTAITSTADDQVGIPGEDTVGWDQYMGWGRINLFALLSSATGGVASPTSVTCTAVSGDAHVTWNNGESYSSIVISRNGTDIATLGGTTTSYWDFSPPPGFVAYGVRGIASGTASTEETCSLFFSGGATDLIWQHADAATGTVDSANFIESSLLANGRDPIIVTDLASAGALNQYQAIWVCLGIYPDNHVLSAADGTLLANYVTDGTGGSLVYMEGGDTWAYDLATDLHPLFDIDGLDDGTGDMGTVTGSSAGAGCDLSGMSFNYTGENSWMDHLAPIGGSSVILSNSSPTYDTGIFNDGGSYRSIGVGHEFGGLANGGTTRDQLMDEYLHCLGLIAMPQPISGLFCTVPASSVQLSWVDNDVYSAIEVSRNGSLVATLSGSATSYIDSSPENGLNTYSVVGFVAGAPTAAAQCAVSVDLPDNVLRAGDHSGAPGQVISALVRADLGLTTNGFSFGGEFDTAVLQVDDVDLSGTITGTLGADFFVPNIDNTSGLYSVGVVLDLTPPLTVAIPVGDNQAIVNVHYAINAGASIGTLTTLDLPAVTPIAPPVSTVFVQGGGTSYAPQRVAGSITVEQTLNLVLGAGTASGPPGGGSDHYTWCTNEVPLDGFSYGLDFDSSMLSADFVDLNGSVAAGADFFAPTIDNTPGGGYYTVGCVIDLAPPIVDEIAPGTQQFLVHTHFSVDASASPGTFSNLTISSAFGVATVFTISGGFSATPSTAAGLFQVTSGGAFIRGDVDMDTQLMINDPVTLLSYLVGGGLLVPCFDSSDANDDGVLDIADPVYNLAYQFSGGPQPPAPFPGPGADPTEDALGCAEPL